MNRLSRRKFLQVSSSAALGAGLASRSATIIPAAASTAGEGKKNPSETIVVGVIGCGGRGMAIMNGFLDNDDVRVAAVCDVYEPHRARGLELAGEGAQGYADWRDLLEHPELDVAVVTTPPHWHPLQTVAACDAGLDVYVEKPIARKPQESRAMLDAARRNNRVTQVGTQIHANENYHRVAEIVQSGVLGHVTAVRNVLSMNETPDGIGQPDFEDPPDNLDWNMWLGPLPEMRFNWAKFNNGLHRYFAELIDSWLHEMGPHIVDLPYWALDLGAPKEISAVGGKFAVDDISTVPDTMEVVYQYDDKIMTWSNMCANSHGLFNHTGEGIQRRLGISFHGSDATLIADYGSYDVISENERVDESDLPEPYLERSPGHIREFLDAVKTREQPSCSLEYHYNIALALNLGNIAFKAGRKIEWDADNETIVGDTEAQELAQANYRDPWQLPV